MDPTDTDKILKVAAGQGASLAFVFPGQGSQRLGMLNEWVDNPIVQETFDDASQALGYNVWELAQNGPETQLNQTEFTQPALLTAGVALYRVWRSKRTEVPVVFAGHSLGEYTALVCAEALNLKDGVKLVAERGRLMQAAVPKGAGAMAAIIGLADEVVIELCEQVNREGAVLGSAEKVEPANFNAPLQVVVAGHAEAVTKAMDLAKTMGAKRSIPLPVSVPSHCSLMKSASLGLEKVLETTPLLLPKIPVLHNVDVLVHGSLKEIRRALVNQLHNPVRWTASIQRLEKAGIKTVLECGPGAVLLGLNKRISATLNCGSVNDLLLNENALNEGALTE